MAADYPEDLKYHPEHDWARIDGDVAVFGVTWYAQDALGQQRVPDLAGALGRRHDLDAVLAGVAGAADQAVDAGDRDGCGAHPRREVAAGDPLDRGARLGALDGEHRVAVRHVGDLHVEARGVVGQPGVVALVVGRVGDRQEARTVAGQPIGEEVVEHSPVLAAEQRVLGSAFGELGHVVGQQPLQERLGVWTTRLDLAHVRDVEDPRCLADRHVLLAHALVLDRHLPADERHQPRAGRPMAVVKRGSAEGFGGGGHAAERLPAIAA